MDKIIEGAEKYLHDYMISQGWEATPMDLPRRTNRQDQAADWLFNKQSECLLCEVKTITSTLRGVDNTEGDLDQKNGFRRKIRHLSQIPEMSQLPFDVLIDNRSLYSTDIEETEKFIQWLKKNIKALAYGEPPYGWHFGWFSTELASHKIFSTTYKLETDKGKLINLNVRVMPKSSDIKYQFDMNAYGNINKKRIEKSIRKSREQLEFTFERIKSSTLQANCSINNIPRVTVLYFDKPIDPFRHILQSFEEIYKTLSKYQDLSAIVILNFIPENLWSNNYYIGFFVLHNSFNSETPPLDRKVFDSPDTHQYDLETLKNRIVEMNQNPLYR